MRLGSGRYFFEVPVDKLTLKSHDLKVTEEGLMAQVGHTSAVIEDLVWKMNQELARLHRLLPEPPPGYFWDFEHLRSEDLANNKITFRIVATLKEKY